MRKKSTVSQLEAEKQVILEAMKIWPERRDEYLQYLTQLNGRIGRTKRAARLHKHRAIKYQQGYAYKKELDRGFRYAMETG